jgi:hypothetical protein
MKPYLTLLLLFILFNTSRGQNPGSISGNALWLKADTTAVKYTKDPSTLDLNHFNFNPVVDISIFKNSYRNIVTEQYSLFVVFKSDFEEERSVMTLRRGGTKVLISNKEVLNDKEMLYKGEVNKGIILSYINGNNDKNGKKKNSLLIDELFARDKEGKEQLMELIYFPRLLSKLERQKMETYLSIKYGISITENFDYLDSKSEKIWDTKENSTYGNRVTGIGRDDAYGLYQKQSGNSLKDGIYIGLGIVDTTNAHNKYAMKDRSFLVWGDNRGKTLLSLDKNKRLKKMARTWKMDVTAIIPQDSITTQLKINKKEFAYINKSSGKEFLWLCVNTMEYPEFNYTGAKYIRQSSEDENFIYFNDIIWDSDGSGSDIFSFIQGPDFMIEHNEDFACESDKGVVSVKLIGGTLPYNLNFDGRELTTENEFVEFTDIPTGAYSLKATEAKGIEVLADISIDSFSDTEIILSPIWYLNAQQEVTILPVVHSNTPANLSFEWVTNGKTVSTEKEFTTKTPGDYTFIVSDAKGCKKSIPFKVEGRTDTLSSQWKLYPNPTKSGEQFSIRFNLEKESEVILNISSMEGKQLLYKNLGLIKDFTYQDVIITSGVYLVSLQIGNTSETVKLIVH